MAKRHQYVEHAILTLINGCDDRDGYPNTMPGLASILRRELPDITDREILDALKRLNGRYLSIYKYMDSERRFDRFPDQIADEERVFYRADFRLRRTPHTDPQMQALALEIHPPEAAPMTSTISEAGRKARFERWEQLGLDRVKADLLHNGGSREVGGSQDVHDLAWEWVRMKEAEVSTAVKQPSPEAALSLISETRLQELRALGSGQFDFKKLIRLCEEINIAYNEGCYFATAMLTRSLLDHVPPIFGKITFDEVASNYGGKSFKGTMQHLQNASRNVADGHLHQQIRKSETLPTAQQVNCSQQLDALLEEVVRITR